MKMVDRSGSSCSDGSGYSSQDEEESALTHLSGEKTASKPHSLPDSEAKSSSAQASTKLQSSSKSRLFDNISKADVLLGRGKRNQNWPGNELFREYVRVRSKEYIAPGTNKFVRDEIAKEIVEKVYQNGGRFLQEVNAPGSEAPTSPGSVGNQAWTLANHSTIRTKTKQALRDLQKRLKYTVRTEFKKIRSGARNLVTGIKSNGTTIQQGDSSSGLNQARSAAITVSSSPNAVAPSSQLGSVSISIGQPEGMKPLQLPPCPQIPDALPSSLPALIRSGLAPMMQLPLVGLRGLGGIPLRNVGQQSYQDDTRLVSEALAGATQQQQQQQGISHFTFPNGPSFGVPSSMFDRNQHSMNSQNSSNQTSSNLLLQTLLSNGMLRDQQDPTGLAQLLINDIMQQQQQEILLRSIIAQQQRQANQQQHQQEDHRGWLSLMPPLPQPSLQGLPPELFQSQDQGSNAAAQRLLLSLLLANSTNTNHQPINTSANISNTSNTNSNTSNNPNNNPSNNTRTSPHGK